MPGACDTPNRCKEVVVENRNQYWTIEIATYQLTNGIDYPGYIKDTGVVVGATNIPPMGSSQSTDPCVAKGAPIMPTICRGSMTVKAGNQSTVVSIPDRHSPPGRYTTRMVFGLDRQPGLVEGEELVSPEVYIEFLDDEMSEAANADSGADG